MKGEKSVIVRLPRAELVEARLYLRQAQATAEWLKEYLQLAVG